MMSYINEADFVIENKELVYPEIITDGLQLYYDAKGKRDTDYHRDTMLDMSGNKNHGELHNFAYEKHSGYKNGLVFDYIDDKLVRPELDGIDENNFTYQLNSNILAFTGDEVKIVKNGSVEVGGQNLLRNTSDELKSHSKIGWDWDTHNLRKSDLDRLKIGVGDELTLSVYIDKPTQNARAFIQFTLSGTIYRQNYGSTILQGQSGWSELTIKIDSADLNNLSFMSVAVRGTSNSEGTIRISNKKLEKGNKATDWTPAPEDLIKTTELKGNILGDIENIIDGLYKTEVLSGEEIYTDKSDDAVVHVDVDGKSYQNAGSGKNLFNITNTTPYNTSSVIKKGEWYVANDGNYGGIIFDKFETKIGKTYTISFTYQSSNNTGHYTISNVVGSATRGIKYQSNTNLELTADGLERRGSITFTANANENISICLLRSGTSGSISYKDIQIEEGSTATAYEPPAPTPDYPIEINSLNDFDVVSSVGRENLLRNSKRTVTNSGYSVSAYTISDKSKIESGKKYAIRVKGKLQSYSTGWYINIYNQTVGGSLSYPAMITMNPSNKVSDNEWVGTFTMPPLNEVNGNIGLYPYPLNSSHTKSATVEWIKLEKIEGTSGPTNFTLNPSDVSYDTYSPTINKINLLLDEPLRSVGDVKDRLFRDVDGLWKVERNVGIQVLSGDKNWSKYNSTSSHSVFQLSASGAKRTSSNNEIEFISDRIRSISRDSWALNNDIESISPNSSGGGQFFIITIQNSRLADLTTNSFKLWLKSSPIKVQYKLISPTIETLDQELQDRLNNLRSFEDSNYVYTVLSDEDNYLSKNLKPTLHAKFLYNNWYKEDRVINNLMIYNRALTNHEMLQNYKTIKRRWGM